MISSFSSLQQTSITTIKKGVTRNCVSLYQALRMSGFFQGILVLAMQNDSNRGSVKSTLSSSEACQLLLLEVNSISLSIYSAEMVCASLVLFRTHGILSTSSGRELELDNSLLDWAGLISSVSIGPDNCNEHWADCTLEGTGLFSSWLLGLRRYDSALIQLGDDLYVAHKNYSDQINISWARVGFWASSS